jgi:hypothetical protein
MRSEYGQLMHNDQTRPNAECCMSCECTFAMPAHSAAACEHPLGRTPGGQSCPGKQWICICAIAEAGGDVIVADACALACGLGPIDLLAP